MVRVICLLLKKEMLYLTLFTQSLSSANIDQSAPNLVKIFMSNRIWMNLIMGPIGPEQLQLFALELGKIATFHFVYSLAFTNINQSAPNLVTMNMSIDLRWVWLWVKSYQIGECYLPLKRKNWTSVVYLVFTSIVNLYCLVLRWVILDHHGPLVFVTLDSGGYRTKPILSYAWFFNVLGV